jgi:hypothetical protein
MALKSYEAAAASLVDDEPRYDDARCDLAMVETKIGNTLLKMGKGREAGTHFDRALDAAKLSVSLEHNDFPALNAAAEAHSGAADLAAYEARNEANKSTASKLRNDACTSYEKSLTFWKHISNPARINGNGYLSSNPGDIARRFGSLQNELSRQTNRQRSQIGAQAFSKKLKLKMIFTKSGGRVQNSPHIRHFRWPWSSSPVFEAERFNHSRTSPGARQCGHRSLSKRR